MTDAEIERKIVHLIHDCAHCIDDDRLEAWPDFFSADARYVITSRENHANNMPGAIVFCDSRGMLEDRIASLRKANIFEPHNYRHLISAIRVGAAEGGVYPVVSSFAVVRIMQDGAMALFSTGKCLDKVALDGGKALFKERVFVCDSSRVDTLIVIPL